eukprot:scaffold92028_cov19-Prasinocladus_malaysianus.AAC.1
MNVLHNDDSFCTRMMFRYSPIESKVYVEIREIGFGLHRTKQTHRFRNVILTLGTSPSKTKVSLVEAFNGLTITVMRGNGVKPRDGRDSMLTSLAGGE